jgi:hypothetical protein
MRRPVLIALVAITLLLVAFGVVLVLQQQGQAPVAANEASPSTEDVPRVSAEALRGQLATSNPPLVWDFRPASTFAEGHIPGSHVLTLDAIPDAAANLDRRKAIVTVCA